jgi:O-antigen/teichoic acid export membrane protein
MTNTLDKLLKKFGITKSKALDDTIYTFIVRAAGIIAGTLISIFLGRTLGPKGLGIISLTNQIIGILLLFSLLGIPTVIIKEVSIAFGRKDWEHANSVVSTSIKINGLFSLLIICVGYLLIPYAVNNIFNEPLLELPLKIALFAMLFQVFSQIFSAGVNGYRKIWQSSLVNNALSLLIVIVLLLIQYLINYNITVVTVAWDYAVSRVVVTLVIGTYWKLIRQPSNKKKFIPKPILKVALPLLFARAVGIIATSADVVMIGWLLSARDVGLYSVAANISIVSTIFLQVTNSVIAPKVASMFAENKIKEMEKMIQGVTKYLFLIGVSIFLIILILGKFLLFIWGHPFVEAYEVLIILSFSQAVSMASGAVGLVLTMCNQEKIWGGLMLISALLNIMLNYYLIMLWGYVGAAISTAISLIFMNVIGIVLIKKRINVLMIPLKLNFIKY